MPSRVLVGPVKCNDMQNFDFFSDIWNDPLVRFATESFQNESMKLLDSAFDKRIV